MIRNSSINYEDTFKIHRQQMPCYQDHHQPPIYFSRVKNKAVILVTFLWVNVCTCLPYTKLCQRHSFMSNSFSSTANFFRQPLICSFPLPAIPSGSFTTAVCGYTKSQMGKQNQVSYLTARKGGKRERDHFQFLKLSHHAAAQTAAPAQLKDCTGTEINVCARKLLKPALTAKETLITLWLQAK